MTGIDQDFEELLRQQAKDIRERVYREAYDNLEENVRQTLRKQNNSLLAQILGMTQRWGNEWEVDHCNGRSGQSEIGPLIKDKMHEVAAAFVNEAFDDWEPSAEMLAGIRAEFDRAFRAHAMEAARSLARDRASSYVSEVLGE